MKYSSKLDCDGVPSSKALSSKEVVTNFGGTNFKIIYESLFSLQKVIKFEVHKSYLAVSINSLKN